MRRELFLLPFHGLEFQCGNSGDILSSCGQTCMESQIIIRCLVGQHGIKTKKLSFRWHQGKSEASISRSGGLPVGVPRGSWLISAGALTCPKVLNPPRTKDVARGALPLSVARSSKATVAVFKSPLGAARPLWLSSDLHFQVRPGLV